MSDAPRDLVERLLRIINLHVDSLEKEARTRWLPWQVAAASFTAGDVVVGSIVALLRLTGHSQ